MKINLQLKIALVFVFMATFGFLKTSIAQQKFEKAEFYNVIANGDVDAIDNELTIMANASSNNKEGYEGALLMKKAGFVSPAKKKLKLFKEGRIKLETALLTDNDNTEYHFLRLAIEEHAPKIVKYHADIETDKMIIEKNFKNLSPAVRHAILDYCKNSKVLHAEDFSLANR